MIIADENIFDSIILELRNSGYEVFSVKEEKRGIADNEIAALSLNPPRIILTEDKDFGEIAFSMQIHLTGCILLRYPPFHEKIITQVLLNFLTGETLETLSGKFVTITTEKIRIRQI
jgi:predicted nuclease of predicted toxin-antitoxin system